MLLRISQIRLASAVLAVVLILFVGVDVVAQCPMCKMAAESNLENGGTEGKGLNTGILYMLVLPYLLVGTLGFLWWRNNRSADNSDTSAEQQMEELLSS